MRPIKFRAWHKAKRQMFEVTRLQWSAYTSQEFYMIELLSMDGKYMVHQIASLDTDINETCELIQFTGLVDKNGREIYQGDILKNTVGDGAILVEAGFFRPRSIPFVGERYRRRTRQTLFTKVDTFEVVGSLYEHPELLEKRQ